MDNPEKLAVYGTQDDHIRKGRITNVMSSNALCI